ncbi:unnamed protein product [Effrenium voratum]|nr:unnamed protein product [Effrenium voratum]
MVLPRWRAGPAGRRGGRHNYLDRPSRKAKRLAWSYSRGESCRDVIRTATADWHDMLQMRRDGANFPLCPVLRDLSQCNERDSENGVSSTFIRHGMHYPVPITYTNVGPIGNFPWIKPSDFLRCMSNQGDLHRCFGGLKDPAVVTSLLEEWWDRFKAVHPEHEVIEKAEQQEIDLKRCIPLYIHGDEGVNFKRGGLLVISFQSALGHGTRKATPSEFWENELHASGIPLNFLRTALQTRFLSIIAPRDLYCDDRDVWRGLHDLVTEDLANAQREGVLLGGTRWYPIILGLKGDWSYLVSAGNLERSYRRAPKAAAERTNAPGICHLCMCGSAGSCDWEDLKLRLCL